MEQVSTVLVVAFFIIWFLLSIIFQFNSPAKGILAKFDYLGLLPSWSFFAPIPGTSDYRLVFRDKKNNHNWSEWNEVSFYSEFSFIRTIWNPKKVELKALSDIIQILLKELNNNLYKKNPRLIMLTTPYMALLTKVNNEPCPDDSIERQFAVLSSSGFGQDRKVVPLFVSSSHLINEYAK